MRYCAAFCGWSTASFGTRRPPVSGRRRFGSACGERIAVEELAGNALFGKALEFSPDLGHFVFIGGNPDGSGAMVFDGGAAASGPARSRGIANTCEGELRGRVVHDDDVAHRRACRSAGDGVASITATLMPRCAHLQSAGRADNARTENRDVVGWLTAYPHAEGIVRIKQERRFRCDVCRSGDAGDDFFTFEADASFEDGAEDAGLSPDFAGRELLRRRRGRPSWRWFRCRRASGHRPFRGKERSWCCERHRRRSGEEGGLNSSMWSISAAVQPGDSLVSKSLADGPGELREIVDVF